MSKTLRQFVFPLLAAFIWGMAFVGQDVCAQHLGAITTVCIRNVLASIVLLPFALFRKPEKTATATRKQYVIYGALLGLALTLTLCFQQLAMIYGTESGKAGFLASLYVVFVPLLGLFLHRKVGLRLWIAIAITLIGCYFLCIGEDFSFQTSDIFVIIGTFADSFQILLMGYVASKCDGFKLAFSQFFFVALYSFVGVLAFEQVDWASVMLCLPQLLYLGVFSSAFGFTLQIFSQKGTNPTVVALIFCLESVFAVLGGAVFLGQVLTARETFGCVLMFGASILSQLPVKKDSKTPAND